MFFGSFVFAAALAVLIAALVLLISGKGAVRWIGLLMVVVLVGGGGLLFIGATSMTGSSRTTAAGALPIQRGIARLSVSGDVADSSGAQRLAANLHARLMDAGQGDYAGSGGDHSYSFQSRMFGNSGSMELLQDFALSEAATTAGVRTTVQAALFETLANEEGRGLEQLAIDLSLWLPAADAPEAWVLEVTESSLSWEPGVVPALPSAASGVEASSDLESTNTDLATEDPPGAVLGG